MSLKPIEIARKLGISTSALRHYESWGIVPPPDRAPNGYRLYTEEHYAYFACIRAMLPGFGMDTVRKTLPLIRDGKLDEALWLVNEQQALLHQDKVLAEKTVEILDSHELDSVGSKGKRGDMTIGEISAETGVPSSAIRHWEKEGLLHLPRNSENGYRLITRAHVRQILIIRTLRSANHPLYIIKEVMRELDHHNIENARKIAREALAYLNHRVHHQVRGIHYLYLLTRATGLFPNA